MASVYKKNNRIYISYYDQALGKSRDRSTGLSFNRQNIKLAKQMAQQLQNELDEYNDKLKTYGIEKVTINTAFEHFKRNNSDKHPKTKYEYDWFFEIFKKYFSEEEPCTIINKLNTEDWLSNIRNLPYQRNTLYTLSKVLKKFLGFLFEYNYAPVFKINKDVLIKPEVKSIITFSEDDITKFFDNMDDKNSNFKTTMSLLFYTGLRPSDIYNITTDDLDLKNNLMRYYSQKTDEHFIVPIHQDLISIVEKRCSEVKSGKLLDYDRIDSIGKAFRRYLKKIGLLNKGYTLRTFRKSFITAAHNSGMDLATVSKLVGHHNISTTAKYYNKLSVNKQATELNKLQLIKKEA